MKVDKNNAYAYFDRIERSKEFDKKYYEEKKQEEIIKYDNYINNIDIIDYVEAVPVLGAIADVVSFKEAEKYTMDYPICEYDLGNKKVPYNVIYLCKETKEEAAKKEIESRIEEGTTYEPNDTYIFLGSFLGDRLYDKTISFNPHSKIKTTNQIQGRVFDERFDYINDFMSKVSQLRLSGDYRDTDDLYQLAYVYAKPYEKTKKVSKIKKLLLKRD